MRKQEEQSSSIPTPTRPGNTSKAEWVALMCLIAHEDRELYRELRAEAWEAAERSIARADLRSNNSNQSS